jgi:hypothetical protein
MTLLLEFSVNKNMDSGRPAGIPFVILLWLFDYNVADGKMLLHS